MLKVSNKLAPLAFQQYHSQKNKTKKPRRHLAETRDVHQDWDPTGCNKKSHTSGRSLPSNKDHIHENECVVLHDTFTVSIHSSFFTAWSWLQCFKLGHFYILGNRTN